MTDMTFTRVAFDAAYTKAVNRLPLSDWEWHGLVEYLGEKEVDRLTAPPPPPPAPTPPRPTAPTSPVVTERSLEGYSRMLGATIRKGVLEPLTADIGAVRTDVTALIERLNSMEAALATQTAELERRLLELEADRAARLEPTP